MSDEAHRRFRSPAQTDLSSTEGLDPCKLKGKIKDTRSPNEVLTRTKHQLTTVTST